MTLFPKCGAEALKGKCRHNTDWRGCSSFDSGARFHGRFTVPFAWLIEACLSRNTSQLSHGTSELHRQDDVRLVSTALCWYVRFGSHVFTTVQKPPRREKEVWKQLFESSGLLTWSKVFFFSLALWNLTLQQVAKDFCLCLGWSRVHPTHTASVFEMRLLLEHFSFYCYPTVWINPLITAIFFPFSAGCFYRWREEGSRGRGRKWGVSATGCLLLCAV